MNRPPGKSDTWWARHEAECGGIYTKIQEPAVTKKQLEAMSVKERAGRQKNKLDSWVKLSGKNGTGLEGNTSGRPIDLDHEGETSKPANSKRKASTLVVEDLVKDDSATRDPKRLRAGGEDGTMNNDKKVLVQCPICEQLIADSEINHHLDVVHLS